MVAIGLVGLRREMRVSKDVKITWNGDSEKFLECSVEYDGWRFDGTKDECVEQLESLIGQLEINAREME